VQDLRRFRSFIGLCAGRCGQLLNLSNLANECGISQPTAKSWLSILESSYVVFLLPPYFENFSKRIVKTPKLYFYDTGLASFLLGLRQAEDLDDPALAGSLFENLVIADILKKNHHQYRLQEYWFWRDSAGHEVDLLTRKGGGFEVFEMKSTQTILPKLIEGMEYLTQISKGKVKSRTLVYGGSDSHDRTDFRVRAWHDL
jgi:predicted AAA+ superfamily ATPase